MRIHRMFAIGVLLGALGLAQSALADQQTFRGCLTGTNDNYVLRADDGTLYRLHSDKDINEHVNEMVEVKGRVDNQKREKEASQDQAAAQAANVEIPKFGINVEDIKTISKGCSDMTAQKTEGSESAEQAGVASNTQTAAQGSVTAHAQAAEQNGVPQPGSVAAAAAAANGEQTGEAAESGKYQNFTGCMTGTDDNYVLRADDGTLYRLHSDKDLDEHVGERVLVHGRIDNQKRDREAQAAAPSESAAGVNIPKTGINVEDIKTISKGCSEAPQK